MSKRFKLSKLYLGMALSLFLSETSFAAAAASSATVSASGPATTFSGATPFIPAKTIAVDYVFSGQLQVGGIYTEDKGYKGGEYIYVASVDVYGEHYIYGTTTRSITAQQDTLRAAADTTMEVLHDRMQYKAAGRLGRAARQKAQGYKPGAEGLMFEWPRAHKLEKAPDYVAAKPKHIRDLLGIEIASKLNTKHALIKGIDSIYAPFFAREDKIGFVTHREEGYLNNWQWVSNPPEEISHASFDMSRLYSVAGDPRNRARPLPIVGGAKVTLRYVIKKDQMEKYWDMIHANYGINHRSYRYEPNGGWGNWPNDHPKLDDSDSGYYEVLVKLIRNQSYGFAEKGLLYEFIPDGEDFFQVNPTKPPKVNVTKPPKVNVTNTLKAEAKTLKAEAKNPPKGARKVSGSAAAAK